MKRFYFIFILFVFSITNIFAFNITNSNNQQTQYFSINSPIVKINTNNSNTSNFTVSYQVSNSTSIRLFTMNQCDNIYCGSFSILDLINSSNNSFSGATKFNISLNNNSKIIYLDLEKPMLNITSNNITSTDIKFNYTYYDNSNKISKILVYQLINSDLILLADLTNKTSYDYEIKYSGNITFLFKIEDFAGNFNTLEKKIQIQDIFPPKIDNTFLTFKDNLFSLKFKAEDENLNKYEIEQNGLILSSKISGTSIEKEINLPFTSSNIILRVYDTNLNQINKTINLDYRFTNSYPNKYTNKKKFQFYSDANSCHLISIDSNTEGVDFVKSSKEFSINLNLDDTNKEYTINFYCQNNNFKEYYSRPLFYDTQKPTLINLSSLILDDGRIKLMWNKSFDAQSEVNYYLYRDSEVIYSGSNLYFIDEKVSYPNSYNYYLKVKDSATNYIMTNSLDIIPKKVNVLLSTNILSNQVLKENIFPIKVSSEKNVKLNLEVSNLGKIIFNQSKENTINTENNFDINLSKGINKIIIRAYDKFNNSNKLTYFVTYSPPVIINHNINTQNRNSISKSIISNNNSINKNSSLTSQNKEELSSTNKTSINTLNSSKNQVTNNLINTTDNKNYNFFNSWFFYLIIIFLILFIAFYFGKISFNNNYNNKIKNKKYSKKSDDIFFGINIKRKDDSKLGSSLNKIKRSRIQRQEELKREKLKQKLMQQRKPINKLREDKINDIAIKKNDIHFSFKTNNTNKEDNKNKSNNIQLKKILTSINNNILKIGDKFRNKINSQIDKIENNHKIEENQKFTNYLDSVNKTNSWDNHKDYMLKTQIEKQKEFDRIQEEKQKKLEEKERIKQEKALIDHEKELEKQKKLEEKEKLKEEKQLAKQSLDNYLLNKSNKKSFYFAEKNVEKDINSRK